MASTLIIATALLLAASIALARYLKRSAREHRHARAVWQGVSASAEKVIVGNFPDEVKEMALGLSMTAGCGCYIRSLMIAHYTPGIHNKRKALRGDTAKSNRLSAQLKTLDFNQKKALDQLVGSVIVFDMYSNTLQGWFMRRILRKANTVAKKAVIQPVPQHVPSRAERDAVIRTVTKKRPELCAAQLAHDLPKLPETSFPLG